MDTKIIPVIVSTHEALSNAVASRWPLIYAENSLCLPSPDRTERTMNENGYLRYNRVGKKGVFYFNASLLTVKKLEAQGIHDPQGIL